MVCNSGTSLVPAIDGRSLHFYHVGIHDALFVMQDAETKTLWNHITGEAVLGPLAGRTLGPLSNLLHMTVSDALAVDPATRVAISDRAYRVGDRTLGSNEPAGQRPIVGMGRGGRGAAPDDPRAAMNPRFAATLGREDDRRPRMDMGLGLWTAATARYYPVERIRERGSAFLDRLDGRSVLVYIEPESNTPAAVYVDAAAASREGSVVTLADGSRVRAGIITRPDGSQHAAERPQQMFTRWYGFSLTFPGCEVFEG